MAEPVSIFGDDAAAAGTDQAVKATGGAVHVHDAGGGVGQAATPDLNAAVAGDVDAAVAAATGLRLVGIAYRESAGTPAAATFHVVHGATGAGGDAIIPVELAANESGRDWFGDAGIAVPNGLSIDHVAGTFDVTLFTKVV